MKQWILAFVVFAALRAFAQEAVEYTAEDFSRLVKENPLVLVGKIRKDTWDEDAPNGIPLLKVGDVLKNELQGVEIKKNDVLKLDETSGNLYWASAVIKYEKKQRGVWIINAVAEDGQIKQSSIIAHFILDEESIKNLATSQKVRPIEQWGDTPDTNFWGVVKASDTRSYDKHGEFAGNLKVGSVMDIRRFIVTTNGDMAVGPIEGQKNGELILWIRDMNLVPGTLSKIDADRKGLYVREAQLIMQIDEMKAKLLHSKNPHGSEFDAVKTQYDRYWVKVKDLQKKRDTGSGPARMQYLEELRRMKGDDNRLAGQYDNIKKKYAAWQKANSAMVPSSPELTALEKELASIREKLK